MSLFVTVDGKRYALGRDAPTRITVTGPEAETTVEVEAVGGGAYLVTGPEGGGAGFATRIGDTLWVRWRGRTYRYAVDRSRTGGRRAPAPGGLTAPMPGQVLKHLVDVDASVEPGTPLVVLEAMKMQLEIKAPHAGRVRGYPQAEGARVPAGALLVDLEEAGP